MDFLEVVEAALVKLGLPLPKLGLADRQEQRVVHDVELFEHFEVLGDGLYELELVLAGHVDEAVGRVEVVDVFEHGGAGVFDLALDGRPFQVVQLELDAVQLEVFQRVLHHQEVDFRDLGDLDRKHPVDAGQQALLVVAHVLEVLRQNLDHLLLLLLRDSLDDQTFVVAEKEEAAAGTQRLLGSLDIMNILLQVQSGLHPLAGKAVVHSQRLKDPMRVGGHLDTHRVTLISMELDSSKSSSSMLLILTVFCFSLLSGV